MNYKTIRYPGHCEQMRLLMNDLKLNQDRATLKRILENAVPQTLQDVVIVYVAVTGRQDGELREENYVNKIYPQVIAGPPLVGDPGDDRRRHHGGGRPRAREARSATTASCAQEQFRLADVLANRFGRLLRAGRHQGRLGARSWSPARPASSASRREARAMSSLDVNALLGRLGLAAVNPGTWSGSSGWLDAPPQAHAIDVDQPGDRRRSSRSVRAATRGATTSR